MIIVVNIIANQ